MASRRPPRGRNNRRGTGTAGGASPLTILGSSPILQWARADTQYVTRDGSNRISAWTVISGSGNYAQATGANQPLYVAAGGPNNRPYVSVDSNVRNMDSTLALAAPGTTPTTIWGVMRHSGYVSGRRFLDGAAGAATHVFLQSGASPQCAINNTTTVNTNGGLAVSTWGRFECFFNNNTTDSLKLVTTTVTGANAGNLASTGRSIGSGNDVSSAVFDLCEILYVNRALTASERLQLDAYVTSYYGSGLV